MAARTSQLPGECAHNPRQLNTVGSVFPASSRMLRVAIPLLFLACVLQLATADAGTRKITKLQIGVKKRVENCAHRSSKGDILHIHYRGTLYDTGAEFDSSYKRGTPLAFTLGAGQVISGWDQGLLGICEGEKRKLVIPSDLAYGSAGSPPSIPPHSALVFEVECIRIENRKVDL